MNRIQEENRSLRIKRETKSPVLQKRAKSRRINEEYRERGDLALNEHDYFENLLNEVQG